MTDVSRAASRIGRNLRKHARTEAQGCDVVTIVRDPNSERTGVAGHFAGVPIGTPEGMARLLDALVHGTASAIVAADQPRVLAAKVARSLFDLVARGSSKVEPLPLQPDELDG